MHNIPAFRRSNLPRSWNNGMVECWNIGYQKHVNHLIFIVNPFGGGCIRQSTFVIHRSFLSARGSRLIMSEWNLFESSRVFLFAPDESIQLLFEYPPAAADFLSLDFTTGYVFEIGRTGNLQIKAGLLGVEKYAVVTGAMVVIVPSIKTVAASVRCFAALVAPAPLQFSLISHECDPD